MVSIVLHILIVISFGLSGLRFSKQEIPRAETSGADRFAFHVIEVPDEAPVEKPVEPTVMVSDRASRAADRDPGGPDEAADPYAEGKTDIPEFEMRAVEIAVIPEGSEAPEPDRGEEVDEEERGDLGVEMRPGGVPDYVADDGDAQPATPARPVSFRNLLSRVGRGGGLSFNTYEWDFAPYMLAMKRAIEKHLFPPYAFTHLGLVSGTNVVRFVVMPDGRIESLEVLGSDAHFSLDRTSLRAIESSVPFLPLPKDFPEEHLEVTAHFSYVIMGRE